jgi:hypothetical protein
MGLLNKHKGSNNFILRYLIAAPLIWVCLFPVMLADLVMEIYHHIAFRIYGIPLVVRSHYIRILDREKLPYLTWYEKIGCMYCGYMNGWLHYASTIAGRTESYFCNIAHYESRGYVASEHEKSFAQYGSESALKKRYAYYDLKYGHHHKHTDVE